MNPSTLPGLLSSSRRAGGGIPPKDAAEKWGAALLALFCLPQLLWAQAEDVQTEDVRDPFKPKVSYGQPAAQPGAASQQTITANLEGISISSKGAFAVISGELYEKGEEKLGIKVVQIRKREVDILINGVFTTLSMLPEDMSRPRSVPEKERVGETASSEVEEPSEFIEPFEMQ